MGSIFDDYTMVNYVLTKTVSSGFSYNGLFWCSHVGSDLDLIEQDMSIKFLWVN
jgi:hypothetical protein